MGRCALLLAAIAVVQAAQPVQARSWSWDGSAGSWYQYWDIGNGLSQNHWGDVNVYFMLDWPKWAPNADPPRTDDVEIGAGVCYASGPAGYDAQMSTLHVAPPGQLVVLLSLAA
jgi:hypothetical protein